MTKKEKARKAIADTQAKILKLSEAKVTATQNADKACKAYLAVVRAEIVAELRTLPWERFKGQGSKSQLQATVPEKGALYDLRKLFRTVADGWRRRMQFTGGKDCALFHVEFIENTHRLRGQLCVRIAMDSLRLLEIFPEALDKKLRRAARKVVDDAGLNAEELEKAINAFKKNGGK